jgi:hypothetical protein
MNDRLQRLRRDLTEAVAAPTCSTGYRVRTFAADDAPTVPVHTAMRNSPRDEGGPFGFGDQEPIPRHRKLLWSKAMVVSVAETSGHDPGRHD